MRLAGVLLIIATAACLRPGIGSSSDAHGIHVVRTWKDLRELQPISLGGGVRVRLGIDQTKGPLWSGVQIYCLTEGFQPPHRVEYKRLGPLILSIGPEGSGPDHAGARSILERKAWEHEPDADELLFMTLVPVYTPGGTMVRFLTTDGEEVASVRIAATSKPGPPWMPWEQYLKPGEETSSHVYLENPSGGRALPSWGAGLYPIPPPSQHTSGSLPVLLPAEIDSDFRLSRKGDELSITSSRKFLIVRAYRHLLCRWWVNGKPFVPHQAEVRAAENGVVSWGNKLYITMDFDPARLGASRGDRVTLQILYSESGWETIRLEEVDVARAEQKPDVRITNRVEWIVQ